MYTIKFQGLDGPKMKRSRSILAAIRAGAMLQASGRWNITITDRDGDTMPLDWWQTVANGVRVG